MCLASALSVIWRKGVRVRCDCGDEVGDGKLCGCVKCGSVETAGCRKS